MNQVSVIIEFNKTFGVKILIVFVDYNITRFRFSLNALTFKQTFFFF